MKKTKRIISAILTVLMLIGMMSAVPAFAQDTETVEYIDVTVDEPVVGQTPSYELEIITLYEDAIGDYEVYWFECDTASENGDDWVEMSPEDTFKEGKYYSPDFFIYTNEGYVFSPDVTATVNGNAHDDTFGYVYNEESPTDAYVCYTWGPLVPPTVISNIDVTINAPVIGKTPSYHINNMNVPADAVDGYEVYWFECDTASENSEDWVEMEPTDTFKEGKYYSPDIFIYFKNTHVVSQDTTATVNDKPHDDTFGTVYSEYDENYAYVCYTWGPLAKLATFSDIKEGAFYVDAVDWAVANEITTGATETTFEPNSTCTRAQAVTFLWRTAGCPEPTLTETSFTDIKEGAFYYKAVLWAVENGITTGTSETTFSPNDDCTRGQIVTFLWRALGSEKIEAENPFTDVKEGSFCYDAVLWAVEYGVTTGTSETAFAPSNDCTRGQIVTFLYRAMSF